MQNTLTSEFEQVLEENKTQIYRICKIYAVSPIEPEDLFQEVTINIWKAIPSFEGNSEISTWVYRVALNVCMRYKNKLNKFKNKMITLESIEFELALEIPDLSLQEKVEALYSCIKSLNDKDQTIVILSLEDMPYRKIAEITGLTENYIAVKMKRVRQLLLECVTSKLD